MEIIRDKYIQALALGVASYYIGKNHRAVLYDSSSGQLRNEYLTPEVAGALVGLGYLGWHEGYLSRIGLRGPSFPPGSTGIAGGAAPGAQSAAAAANTEFQAMTLGINPLAGM